MGLQRVWNYRAPEHMYILFSIVSVPIYLPTNCVGGFIFFHTLSRFIVCRFFDCDWCEVIPYCSFGFPFSSNYWCWVSFHVLFGHLYVWLGFPGGSDSEEFTCSARAQGLTPGLGRSPGDGNVYPLQYFFLENSMDRGAWHHKGVHGVTKSWTWLSD